MFHLRLRYWLHSLSVGSDIQFGTCRLVDHGCMNLDIIGNVAMYLYQYITIDTLRLVRLTTVELQSQSHHNCTI